MAIKAHLAPKKGAQKRTAARQSMRLSTSARTVRGSAAEVTILDLSTGGMLIETSAKLEVGDAFEVELPRTGVKLAEVVWSCGTYYGCRFDEPVAPAAVSAALLKSMPGASPTPGGTTTVGTADLGSRIASLRTEKAWSLDELADRLGVSRQAVWYWETGQRIPRADLFRKIADALGVSEHDLLEPGGAEASNSASIEEYKSGLAGLLGVSADKIRILVEF